MLHYLSWYRLSLFLYIEFKSKDMVQLFIYMLFHIVYHINFLFVIHIIFHVSTFHTYPDLYLLSRYHFFPYISCSISFIMISIFSFHTYYVLYHLSCINFSYISWFMMDRKIVFLNRCSIFSCVLNRILVSWSMSLFPFP